MSEKEMRRMFRHRAARLRREERAVSPVVATLILILVAVAAAAALYLWLVAWQGQVTNGIGNPNAQTTLNIGGSTTMYAMDNIAINWFEANNSNVKFANNQGGSGSGLLALCQGHVDISAASRPITSSDLTACPALSGAVSTVVGYDAVVPIVPTANVHGMLSISGQTMNIVYWQNGGQPTVGAGYPSGNLPTTTVGGKLTPASWGIKAPAVVGGALTWALLPQQACFDAAVPAGSINAQGFLTGAGSGACTWTYDASATSGNAIHVYARYDNGGTEEAFDNNVMGIKCGTDQQLASCGFTVANNPASAATGQINGYTGNPAVITAVSKDADALGFTSWGQSTAPTSLGGGVGLISDLPLQGTSQNAPVTATLATIKVGIAAGYGNQVAGGFAGWRPLVFNTMGQPTGESLRFIQFFTQPGTENTLDALDFFISTYQ